MKTARQNVWHLLLVLVRRAHSYVDVFGLLILFSLVDRPDDARYVSAAVLRIDGASNAFLCACVFILTCRTRFHLRVCCMRLRVTYFRFLH